MIITLLETSWNILKCFRPKFYSEKCILLDFLVGLHDKFQGTRELDDKKLKRRMDSVTQGCLSSHEQDILLKVQTTNKFVLLYLSCCNNWKPSCEKKKKQKQWIYDLLGPVDSWLKSYSAFSLCISNGAFISSSREGNTTLPWYPSCCCRWRNGWAGGSISSVRGWSSSCLIGSIWLFW